MNTMELTKVVGMVMQITDAPAPNRSGKIKLDSGQILSAYPQKLKLVSEGETGEFGCTETHKNGVVFYDVKTARPITPAIVPETFRAPAPRPQPQQQRIAPVQQHVTPPNGNGNGNGNSYYRPTHPRDSERMFVAKILGDLIGTGRISDDVDTLTRAVNDLRQVWQQTFGADDPATG